MRSNSFISKLKDELLDLVYPPGLYCICCAKITDESRTYGMCNDCMDNIRWITGRSCDVCGKALGETDPGPVCYNCRQFPHVFDKGYACCEYGMHEKNLLYEVKYGGRGDVGETLSEVMCDRMQAEFGEDGLREEYDILIPVPAYNERKLRRGYNQAELLCKALIEKAGLTPGADILIRSRETMPMKGLGPGERQSNIYGAFVINEEKKGMLLGARVLLVDDIFTTGATLDEAARVLKEAGAVSVDTLVFAAGADILS